MTTRVRKLLGWFTVAALLPALACAHRLDEYLQAVIVVIEPRAIRLELNLIPGADVTGDLLGAIDSDHDGAISPAEAVAYGESVKRDLRVELDETPLALKVEVRLFPSEAELHDGTGIIQLVCAASIPALKGGSHRLSVENRHRPAGSIYLFNAAKPYARGIEIGAQKRNQSQSMGEIEFTVR